MAKQAQEDTAITPPIELSLTEFCRRLSETVRRPEIIGAFEHTQRIAGNLKSTEAAYRELFDKFVNTPV